MLPPKDSLFSVFTALGFYDFISSLFRFLRFYFVTFRFLRFYFVPFQVLTILFRPFSAFYNFISFFPPLPRNKFFVPSTRLLRVLPFILNTAPQFELLKLTATLVHVLSPEPKIAHFSFLIAEISSDSVFWAFHENFRAQRRLPQFDSKTIRFLVTAQLTIAESNKKVTGKKKHDRGTFPNL